MDQTAFRIGEVATGAGVSVDTVRYYERLKLLPRASRSSGKLPSLCAGVNRARSIYQASSGVGPYALTRSKDFLLRVALTNAERCAIC